MSCCYDFSGRVIKDLRVDSLQTGKLGICCLQPVARDCPEDPIKCSNTDERIVLLGVGAAGSVLLNKLSTKFEVQAFEAGWNRLNDGWTYNTPPLFAPFVHSPLNVHAFQGAIDGPALPLRWLGLILNLPWTINTATAPSPAVPSLSGFGLNPGALSNVHAGC